MKTERRWLKAAITAATEQAAIAMPFHRGAKKRPAALILRTNQGIGQAVAAR